MLSQTVFSNKLLLYAGLFARVSVLRSTTTLTIECVGVHLAKLWCSHGVGACWWNYLTVWAPFELGYAVWCENGGYVVSLHVNGSEFVRFGKYKSEVLLGTTLLLLLLCFQRIFETPPCIMFLQVALRSGQSSGGNYPNRTTIWICGGGFSSVFFVLLNVIPQQMMFCYFIPFVSLVV